MLLRTEASLCLPRRFSPCGAGREEGRTAHSGPSPVGCRREWRTPWAAGGQRTTATVTPTEGAPTGHADQSAKLAEPKNHGDITAAEYERADADGTVSPIELDALADMEPPSGWDAPVRPWPGGRPDASRIDTVVCSERRSPGCRALARRREWTWTLPAAGAETTVEDG